MRFEKKSRSLSVLPLPECELGVRLAHVMYFTCVELGGWIAQLGGILTHACFFGWLMQAATMLVDPVAPPFCHLRAHGWTLQAALEEFGDTSRTIDVFEVWSGVSSIAKAVQRPHLRHLQANTFDRLHSAAEDILTKEGFKKALQQLFAVKPKGLAWFAPECKSFVFVNSSNCKRTRSQPEGDESYAAVASGNRQAEIMIFMYCVALIRDVHPVGEQPAGSAMFRYPPVRHVIDRVKPTFAVCARCPFDTKEFGQRMLKLYKLMGNPWVAHLARKCECPDRKHQALVKVQIRVRKKQRKMAITGVPARLKASGAYPEAMGAFVIDTWLAQKDKPQVQPIMKKPEAKKGEKGTQKKTKATKKQKAPKRAKQPVKKAEKKKAPVPAGMSWKCMALGGSAPSPVAPAAAGSSWKQMALV